MCIRWCLERCRLPRPHARPGHKAETARHRGGPQLSAFSARMGDDVAGDGDQDVSSRRAVTPLPILRHASLEHLIGIEFGVLTKPLAQAWRSAAPPDDRG